MTISCWQIPESHPSLGDDEIHVWQRTFNASESELDALRQILSPDENARAERFRLPVLRNNFIVARGSLRVLLSRYLEVEPSQVSFRYQSHGKPALDETVHSSRPIRFNISHSGDWVLYAVTLGREVGVDVECHHLVRDFEGIVNRFFSIGEREAISRLPEEKRSAAFFRCWTLKEAYLKARGTGLAFPLDQFEVVFGPDAAPEIRDSVGNVLDWSCLELPCESDYTAGLVAEGKGWQARCWKMPA